MHAGAVTWLVTARHRVLEGDWRDPEWVPYGIRHARRSGDSRACCGAVSIEWAVFCDLQFDPEDERSCLGCSEWRRAASGLGALVDDR